MSNGPFKPLTMAELISDLQRHYAPDAEVVTARIVCETPAVRSTHAYNRAQAKRMWNDR